MPGTCSPSEVCRLKAELFAVTPCTQWGDPTFIGCEPCRNQAASQTLDEARDDITSFIAATKGTVLDPSS